MQTFKALRDAGEFLEWAEVHGNYYATSKVWIKGQIDKGHDILLEIDWQGRSRYARSSPRRSAYSSCRLRWRSSKTGWSAVEPTANRRLPGECLARAARCAM